MNSIIPVEEEYERQAIVGAAADYAARSGVFEDYRARRAANTLRRQLADLALFAEYLAQVKFYPIADGRAAQLQGDPEAWAGITHGLVAGFVRWQLQRGYAIGSINVRLSTIKQYAKLAFQAGALSAEQNALIRTVTGYQYKEQKRVDEKRIADGAATRIGAKKATAVSLDAWQVKALKKQPDTPQGRRDALLMCLLLDHGLRCGEIAALDTGAINLEDGTLIFYRPKVAKTQTHRLSRDTFRAAQAWLSNGDVLAEGKLLRASMKSKIGDKLGKSGMSERAITKRVEYLGQQVGAKGLSAHDGRHSWATRAARNKTDAFALQEAGGWNSLAMPRRYIDDAKIANEEVKLGQDY